MHVHIEKCPHCFATIKFEFKYDGWWVSKLGRKNCAPCPKCHKPVSDGYSEWNDMDTFHKVIESLWWVFAGIWLTVVFSIIGGFGLYWITDGDISLWPAVMLVPLAGFGLTQYRFYQEREKSKRRFPKQIKKAYGPHDPSHPDHLLWANREGPYKD